MRRDEAIEELRELLPRDTEVLLVLEHVSSTGMTRHIKPYVTTPTGMRHLSGLIEEAGFGKRFKKRDGIAVGGCGMDMGFHLVYTVSHYLWGDGYALRHRWL